MEEINKQIILRRLLTKLARMLADSTAFNEIARIFFENGIIDKPERPYAMYDGSKVQYSLEKLLAAQNKNGFAEMISSIQFHLCYESGGPLIDDREIVFLMKSLGYTTEDQSNPDWDPSLISPKDLPAVTERRDFNKRIVIDNLPSNITVLINELNDNLDRNNFNASALLIRKILTISCFISLDKIGKSSDLEGKELNEVLSIVQKKLKLSDRVMSKVKSAKWIGDSANHSYKIKINESDVELAATGLRIFLEEAL